MTDCGEVKDHVLRVEEVNRWFSVFKKQCTLVSEGISSGVWIQAKTVEGSMNNLVIWEKITDLLVGSYNQT